MNTKLRIFGAVILCLAAMGCTSVKQAPQYAWKEWISDAKVCNGFDAAMIALKVLKERYPNIELEDIKDIIAGLPGISVMECGACFKIDFEIPGFAEQGDRVWPLTFHIPRDRHERLIWINVETGEAKLISSENICSELVESRILNESGGAKLIKADDDDRVNGPGNWHVMP